jgi:hypothetical protein
MISLFISLTPLAVALASLLAWLLVHIAPKRQDTHVEQPLTLVSLQRCIFALSAVGNVRQRCDAQSFHRIVYDKNCPKHLFIRFF